MDLSPEADVDVAEAVRRAYDPLTREWSAARTGDFWDGVAFAHALGRLGEGRTVAVIDDGFDMTVPALAEHGLVWPHRVRSSSTHGTVAALLVLAVAPRARLRLYPTGAECWRDTDFADGRYDADRVEGAIAHAAACDTTVLALGLGQRVPVAGTGAGGHAASRTRLGTAVRSAVDAGKVAVCPWGDAAGHPCSPADEDGVVSVASRPAPADITVALPPDVLGAGLATPLVAGLAALLAEPRKLVAQWETAALARRTAVTPTA